MRRLEKWMLAAILICSMSAFTACTSDNGDNPVAPQPGKKQFQLTRYLSAKDSIGVGVSTDYTYDVQGRVILEMETIINGDGTHYTNEIRYTYADHKIIEETETPGDSYQHVYTLNDDGLIVKNELIRPGEEPQNQGEYQYDSEGKLIIYDSSAPKQTVFTWKDGDLICYEVGDQTESLNRTDFTPSDLTVEEGFVMPITAGIFNEVLYRQGYYGKTPKHLVAKVVSKAETSSMMKTDLVYDYTYTLADGHITKMVEEGTLKVTAGSFVMDGPSKNIYTYVWEEKNF